MTKHNHFSECYYSKTNRWYWHLYTADGRLLGAGIWGYKSQRTARNAWLRIVKAGIEGEK